MIRRGLVVVLLVSGVAAGYGSALAQSLGYAGGWSSHGCPASASSAAQTSTPP